MRVRIDAFLGNDYRLDLSFLQHRKTWLCGTGLYIEFMLRGVYDKEITFEIRGDQDAASISHYSWNRFFLNLKSTSRVNFIVKEGGREVINESLLFTVVDLKLPLVVVIPNLLTHPITDIRYMANRLSENSVNTVRFVLFTPGFIKSCKDKGVEHDSFYRLYDIIFSVLTERGVNLIITPFGSDLYPLDLVKTDWRKTLLCFIEHCKKYRIVWDFSSGLRQKELGGMVDSVVGKFNQAITLIVPSKQIERYGGEGLCGQLKSFNHLKDIPENERGLKVAQMPYPRLHAILIREKKINLPDINFFEVQSFVEQASRMGWGSELYLDIPVYCVRRFRFSTLKALYKGYRKGYGEE